VQLTGAGILTDPPTQHPGFRPLHEIPPVDTPPSRRDPPPDDDDQEDRIMPPNGETDPDFTGLLRPTTTLPNVIAAANASGALAIGGLLPIIAALFLAVGKPIVRWGVSTRIGQFVVGTEVVDLLTPGLDLPSPSDLPLGGLEMAQRTGATMVDMLDWLLGPGINFGGPSGPPVGVGGVVVHSWTANGIPFFQMSDGWTWVQKKNGQWKRFKQPKPVVLMPGGAGNLRTLLRATSVVSRQLKKIDKALGSKLGPRRRRASPRTVRGVLADGLDPSGEPVQFQTPYARP
jgi:hypothetical protein